MTMNREALLRAAQLVRPALAAQPYIPALTHIRFDESGITTYNDISALFVDIEHSLKCCIPGDLFIKALNGFTARDVKVERHPKEAAVVVSSGKGRIKIPTLDLVDFPFKWTKPSSADYIGFNDVMLRAMERCLVSVGNNPQHPAQMGVTLGAEEGRAAFYSTDNYTITRVITDTKIDLPADAPIILPTFFCEQMLTLAKAFPEGEMTLYLLENGLEVELSSVGDEYPAARLHSSQLVEHTPLDFPSVIAKNVPGLSSLSKELVPIPDGWEDAFERALLVLGSEVDKAASIEADEEGLHLFATSPFGEADEVIAWKKGKAPRDKIFLNPQHVIRGSGKLTHLSFAKGVLVLATEDATVVHVIAYLGK